LIIILRHLPNQALLAHTCNPSYSGGRDQEDRDSKPAQANRLLDSIFKKPVTKKAGGMAQGLGPEFKPQYHTHTQKYTFPFSRD
jgi:hypothetical protein